MRVSAAKKYIVMTGMILSDAMEDKEEDEALDLYVEGKGGNASKAKNKGPGFKKVYNYIIYLHMLYTKYIHIENCCIAT